MEKMNCFHKNLESCSKCKELWKSVDERLKKLEQYHVVMSINDFRRAAGWSELAPNEARKFLYGDVE